MPTTLVARTSSGPAAWGAGGALAADESLLHGAQRGDARLFARLFERHVGLVRLVVRDNVRDPEDLADCVQEVFTRALEGLAGIRDPAQFRSWLLGIARHVAIDRRRRRRKDHERYAEQTIDDLPEGGRSPSVEVELRQLGQRVRGALAALPPREATAVSLATYLELSPSEIGIALGVSPGNAKVIVHRARRRLRDALTLEMLRSGGGCDDFHLLDHRDVSALGEHVAACARCEQEAHASLCVERD